MNILSVSLRKPGILLAVLVLIVVTSDIAVFNLYPFLCETPWSYSLLFSSLDTLRAYIVCMSIHYAIIDAGLVMVPFLFLLSNGYRPIRRRIWIVLTYLCMLVTLDVLTVVLIDYIALLSSIPEVHDTITSRFTTMIVIIANIDTIVRLWVTPLLIPLIVVYCSTRCNLKSLFSKSLSKLLLASICNLIVSYIIAAWVGLAIDTVIAKFNPLGMFTYFRCVNSQTASYIVADLHLKVSFIPVLQTWGGVARVAVTLVVEALLCRWLASSAARALAVLLVSSRVICYVF